MNFLMYRGTKEEFEHQKDNIDAERQVVLLTDTAELAYRDGKESEGWGLLKGTLVVPRPTDPQTTGGVTLGINPRIKCTHGLYLFEGCQFIPTSLGGSLTLQLILR